jgi:hypothetical protein
MSTLNVQSRKRKIDVTVEDTGSSKNPSANKKSSKQGSVHSAFDNLAQKKIPVDQAVFNYLPPEAKLMFEVKKTV